MEEVGGLLMSAQVQTLFSSIAPKYDLLNTVLSLGIDRLWRRRAVSYLKDCKNVLDFCAGTLALTKELLKVNPNCEIAAVDFSEEMIGEGLRTLPPHLSSPPIGGRTKEGGRLTIVCNDFFKFDSPPLSYDAAMCAYGVRNLDDNPKAIKKIHGLLKPGGKLLLLEFFRPDRWYTWAWHLTYAQFVIPLIGLAVSQHKEAYRHLRDSVRGFYTLDQYVRLLQENGIRVRVAKRLTGGISGLIVAEKPSLTRRESK